ncbi:MAG: hypothetical protein CMM56_02480 [Rhodospirillaceae bacterium]|nr:hypothetical protein [Rhodospirillaceae bacterium]
MVREFNNRFLKNARRLLLLFTYVALSCRVLIPVGYMAAPWDKGGPVILCPTGIPSDVSSESHHDHHHDSEGNQNHNLLWEHCPFGALADTTILTPSIRFLIPQFILSTQKNLTQTRLHSSYLSGFLSRAPPFFI